MNLDDFGKLAIAKIHTRAALAKSELYHKLNKHFYAK